MPEIATDICVSEGFAPVIGDAPVVLLLGSLPGRASIEAGEYYAQKRNAFWRIMGELCGAGPDRPYADRLDRLADSGIALWDVLHSAVRPGSLDADIVRSTERVNDIAGLLASRPGIRLLAFNGRKAAQTFSRCMAPLLGSGGIECPALVTLPSTSPAFAAMPFDEKLRQWQEALVPSIRAARA